MRRRLGEGRAVSWSSLLVSAVRGLRNLQGERLWRQLCMRGWHAGGRSGLGPGELSSEAVVGGREVTQGSKRQEKGLKKASRKTALKGRVLQGRASITVTGFIW